MLNVWLLMAVADGCEGFGFRRARGGYEMHWLVAGARHESGDRPIPGYVRRYANILWRLSHGRVEFGSWVRRFLCRIGSLTECGEFDLPVGPVHAVAVSYHAEWRRGRVSELDIVVAGCRALSRSGIARQELDRAWHGALRG